MKKADVTRSLKSCMANNLLCRRGLTARSHHWHFSAMPWCHCVLCRPHLCEHALHVRCQSQLLRGRGMLCLWIRMGLGARYTLSPVKTERLQCMCGAEPQASQSLPWCWGSYSVKAWRYEKDSLHLNTRFPPNPQHCVCLWAGLVSRLSNRIFLGADGMKYCSDSF